MRSGTMASLSNYKKLFSLQLDENPISKTLTEWSYVIYHKSLIILLLKPIKSRQIAWQQVNKTSIRQVKLMYLQ